MIKLLIADDHTIFRQGLRNLLRNSSDIEIVAEVGNGTEAWDAIQQVQPDIAVLDISMPGLNGLDVAEQCCLSNIPTNIILLTMHDEPTLAIKAKKNQVKGYIRKDDTFDELLEAINTVSSGNTFMSVAIREKLEKYNIKQELSRRESLVLQLIAKGLTNNKIAEKLNISPKTVDTYRFRLMNKLGLHTIAELTQYAVKVKLLS